MNSRINKILLKFQFFIFILIMILNCKYVYNIHALSKNSLQRLRLRTNIYPNKVTYSVLFSSSTISINNDDNDNNSDSSIKHNNSNKRKQIFVNRMPRIVTKSVTNIVSNNTLSLSFPYDYYFVQGDIRTQLLANIKKKDYDACILVYDQMKKQNIHTGKEDMLMALLSVCHKAEHLEKALEIVSDMRLAKIPHSETSYITLIRCYSSAGQTKKALELLNEMIHGKIELKSRLFQPLLDKFSVDGLVQEVLDILNIMVIHNVTIRDEQITSLLSSLHALLLTPTTTTHSSNSSNSTNNDIITEEDETLTNQRYHNKDNVMKQVNAVLERTKNYLLGLTSINMHKIVMKLNNLTSNEVINQG